jgi:hypothetical protein
MRASPLPRAPQAAPMPFSARSMSSGGAVMVVASRLVVPYFACRAAIACGASPPSIMSRPAPPCTCRSMKPGRM